MRPLSPAAEALASGPRDGERPAAVASGPRDSGQAAETAADRPGDAPKPKVLLTGAAGFVASMLLPAFRARYDLTAVDVQAHDRDGNSVAGVVVADLHDAAAARRLIAGQDCVVHLAHGRPPGGARGGYDGHRRNLDLAQQLHQLALEKGVRRVVVASSNHAADWYEPLVHDGQLDGVTPAMVPLAQNFYGWAKAAGELLSFLYASGAFGRPLEAVQVRIGSPQYGFHPRLAPGGEAEHDERALKRFLGSYVSPRDLAQLFCRAVETPNVRDEHGVPFQIVYGISGNTRAFWSLANARRVLGYAPQDDAELLFAAEIAGRLGPGRHAAEESASLHPTRGAGLGSLRGVARGTAPFTTREAERAAAQSLAARNALGNRS